MMYVRLRAKGGKLKEILLITRLDNFQMFYLYSGERKAR